MSSISNGASLKIVDLENKDKVIQFRESRIQIPKSLESKFSFFDFYEEKQDLRIENISRFGMKLLGESLDLNLSIKTEAKATVVLNGVLIFSGMASFVNEYKNQDGSISYGVLINEGEIDLDKVQAIIGYSEESSNLTTTRELVHVSQKVRPEFKMLVADLNTLLQDLRFKLLDEEERIKSISNSLNHKNRLTEHAINIATSLYTPEINKLFIEFKKLTDGFSSDDSIIHKKYFRANFHPTVLGVPFVNRAFLKPRGYAGDFGLMLMFYEYEDIGNTLFEKFFHRFSCNEPAAVANKNRVEYLSQELLHLYAQGGRDEFKVSSIACGPAKEIELFLQDIDNSKGAEIEVVCVDQEELALEYAQKKVRQISSKKRKINSVFLREDAVLGIIKEKPFVSKIKDSDVIISAGLFDYLSDRVATRLIESFVKLVKKGGIVYIGNVSTSNPDTFSMSYFAEWNLVLRDEDGLRSLVSEENIQKYNLDVSVVSESLGLNLFLKVVKK